MVSETLPPVQKVVEPFAEIVGAVGGELTTITVIVLSEITVPQLFVNSIV